MPKVTNSQAIQELLERGVEAIYPSKGELEKRLKGRTKLRVYVGFDPSGPNLHVGHLAGWQKLRQFQNLGHEVIFLVGDFTGQTGDPSDKLATRKPLTREQVRANARNYKKLAGTVLRFAG